MEDTCLEKLGLRVPKVQFNLIDGGKVFQWVRSQVFEPGRSSVTDNSSKCAINGPANIEAKVKPD